MVGKSLDKLTVPSCGYCAPRITSQGTNNLTIPRVELRGAVPERGLDGAAQHDRRCLSLWRTLREIGR